jgi:uncharacterized coiled-coil DUF342 family protein
MNPLDEIKELKAKKAKGETALTKYSTQIESMVEQRDRLVKSLQDEHGISPDELESYLEKLEQKRDALLAEAKEKLDKINL